MAVAPRMDVPVYAAVGEDALERIEDLSARSGIRLVATPRHAAVLVVAGPIRREDREALWQVHDQLPHPRATLWWGASVAHPETLSAEADPVPRLQALHRQILDGSRVTETHLLKDEPPAPWRGRGDHGQGGEGMMGGTPYGRPMAMPDMDLRDGLMLDAFAMRLGPFLPSLPPGLVLDATLQGDVLQSVAVARPPLPQRPAVTAPRSEAPTLAELERLRAARHLRCIARVLVLLQLGPLAERCRRAAAAATAGRGGIAFGRLKSLIRISGAMAAIPPGLGALDRETARAAGGVALPACGEADDPRRDLSAYRELGFEPLTRSGGDVRARLGLWLAEAGQSLALAAAAGARRVKRDAEPASGGGAWAAPRERRLPALLRGLEWQEALLVINSFDIDSLTRLVPGDDEESPLAQADGQL